MGSDAEGLEASFKGSWDEQNLYLLVTIRDASPMSNKEKGEWIWNGDGIEIFLFDLAIDDAPAGGSRVRQLMWNGSQRNSSDRSAWGRLTLVP